MQYVQNNFEILTRFDYPFVITLVKRSENVLEVCLKFAMYLSRAEKKKNR